MKYLLMLYADEVAGSKISPEDMRGFMQTMYAYQEALTKAGAFVETAPLTPTTQAKTVHLDNGEMQVHDGPYAETREQFGGYYIIDVADMDEALAWAAKCPAANWGTIEVRQFATYP